MEFTFQHLGKSYKGRLSQEHYGNDNLAVQLSCWEDNGGYWEPYAKLSVNTEHILPKDQFVAKMYSENEGLVEQFIEAGYFESTGRVVQVGHAYGPVLRITPKFREAVK